MTDRQITTLREIIGRIHRRTTVKPDMSLISLLAKEADEILKKGNHYLYKMLASPKFRHTQSFV